MRFPGTADQQGDHPLYDASGTIAATNTAQLVLPRALSRSFLLLQNTGSSVVYVDFGYARAGTVTMAGSAPNQTVSSVAVTNVGQGYSQAPAVIFYGGGQGNYPLANTTYLGAPLPEEAAPANSAQAHCVMTGSAPNQTVSSIVIDNPGSGYLCAPYCYLRNPFMDPNGHVNATAAAGAIALPVGGEPIAFYGTFCPTTPVVVVGTINGTFTCKYAT